MTNYNFQKIHKNRKEVFQKVRILEVDGSFIFEDLQNFKCNSYQRTFIEFGMIKVAAEDHTYQRDSIRDPKTVILREDAIIVLHGVTYRAPSGFQVGERVPFRFSPERT